MRILVVGSGGREHALAWKLSQEAEVLAAPGNPGIAEECEVVPIAVSDQEGLLSLAKSRSIDLVLVGPEDPLIAGLADRLRAEGLAVFGPGASGARLEGSKAFSKALMKRAGVTTAEFETFTDSAPALDFARRRFDHGRGVAVKASGAALGKGAIVCPTLEQAEDAITMMLDRRELGEAGATVVVEDLLNGPEFSLLTLVNETGYRSLPCAQDYKRVGTGDAGPNTGGMGSYSPVGWVSGDLVARTEERVVAPILSALQRDGIPFRGVLFSGLMVEDDDPYCLEYNVRFGDPETQSVMARLGRGFTDALVATASGVPIPAFEVLDNAAVTVVAASGGYPGSYEKGKPLQIGPLPGGVKIFHAGTSISDGRLVTSGGRVLAVTATGDSLTTARRLAYEGIRSVAFEGMQFRTDIAATASGAADAAAR